MSFSPSAQKALNALSIQAADRPAAPALGKGKCGDPAAFIWHPYNASASPAGLQ